MERLFLRNYGVAFSQARFYISSLGCTQGVPFEQFYRSYVASNKEYEQIDNDFVLELA